ncbi:hypothetical protein C8Q73DRAFT_747714 [Cubamyces lactineus]|nr:hypothetical protein C8Q73DRAFT_747714 [Cubamyces lactineus]
MDRPDRDQEASSSSSPFNFSSPSMQNQIHELAKTLPPPRKQNTACDACRARKVKCNQLPGQDKHCLSKNYPCTHYIQQATTEKKRNAAAAKRPRTLSASSPSGPAEHMATSGHSGTAHAFQSFGSHFPQQGPVPSAHPITIDTQTRDLLAYIFSPPDPSSGSAQTNGSAHVRMGTNPSPPAYAEWGALAHRLSEDSFRIEFALDLVEVFFQIVHSRLPLLNPAQFRNRLHLSLSSTGPQNGNMSPSTPVAQQQRTRNSSSPLGGQSAQHQPQRPLHPALVATVIAWGAKFSEHPLFVADRHRNGGQSAFAKVLINRARDLAEDMKVHRIPNADHVVIALLIEPLQSRFHGFWLGSAIRLLLDLQINHKSVMSNIHDPEARGTMIFAWWMACLADAYRSVYYRRKPMLDDDDYDIDFYTVGPVPPDIIETSPATQPSPREQLEGYYKAAHALARIARQMSRQLWRPATESDGIPADVLMGFMTMLNEWRDEHLSHVGVPPTFPADWDFVSAVTACASDATYHIMWIILCNALDDFGIRELNDGTRAGTPEAMLPQHPQIEEKKRKVMSEALHGALRIAGLAGVLTTNGYLRLDCAVMHVSCIQAGMLLARLGRPEVTNCINGLEQYSYAYEECADQAAEIKRIFQQAQAGEMEWNHMASVAPRLGTSTDSAVGGANAMSVDFGTF